jgi:hypothetical protein
MGKFAVLMEGVRLVSAYSQGRHKATVHKDSDLGEYKVKFHKDGVHHEPADYYTDHKDDAEGTARAQVDKAHAADQKNESFVIGEDGERMIGSYTNKQRKATVHRAGDNSYLVKHHKNGEHVGGGDYETDDKEEAHFAARHFVNSKE